MQNPLLTDDVEELMEGADEVVKTIIDALRQKYGEKYRERNMLYVLAYMTAIIAPDISSIHKTYMIAELLWSLLNARLSREEGSAE